MATLKELKLNTEENRKIVMEEYPEILPLYDKVMSGESSIPVPDGGEEKLQLSDLIKVLQIINDIKKGED